MEQRLNVFEKGFAAMNTLFGIGKYLKKSSIEQPLINLICFRVSQINGCAYCLDMHSKDLRKNGESEQRLYMLSAWSEAPIYTNRERAALAWAEAVTKLTNNNVDDKIYEQARKEFNEQELIDLTLAVTTINTYNRINVAFRTEAGGYQPGQHDAHTN